MQEEIKLFFLDHVNLLVQTTILKLITNNDIQLTFDILKLKSKFLRIEGVSQCLILH